MSTQSTNLRPFYGCNFAVVVPMANEELEFNSFIRALKNALDDLNTGTVYFVVDHASKDCTLELCQKLSQEDPKFVTIWAPDSHNVVDAYITGYKAALEKRHDYIIEMDAGLSHDPSALPMFLRVLQEGNECAFGSRFINGGSIFDSNWKRLFLSKWGTYLSNFLLGTRLHDATSGYQGFHANIVEKFVAYPLMSKAHFYQTEMRFLLRKSRYMEVPIHYRAPSPSVSKKAIYNSLHTLLHYFYLRLIGKAPAIY
jgi:dolichol-phosphate mannosyltransferase